MGPEREYLSVTIPVHPSFLPKTVAYDKKAAYINTILLALKEQPLTLSELALALGYKGISAKLRDTVQEMLNKGTIYQLAEGRRVKFKVK